jgi:hypothetical protein
MTNIYSAAKNYAHLLSFGASKKAKKVEDDKEEMKRAEEEESKKAEEKEKEETDEKESKKAEEDNSGTPTEKPSKVKKAEKEDDSEEDEEDNEKKERAELAESGTAIARARNRERERCAAIFSSPAAAGRIQGACKLAFHTSYSAKEAVSLLEEFKFDDSPSAEEKSHPTLIARMKKVENPKIDPHASNVSEKPTASATAAAIIAAANKAMGKTA